jgi:ABC-2 type transport system ATP-binding protein
MTALDVQGLAFSYRRGVDAVHDLSLSVPTGAILGLLGPTGSGKTTLLQCIAGLRSPTAGRVTVLGADVRQHPPLEGGAVTYVAEGVRLPSRITLRALEAWVSPLYPRWDASLAATLRERFELESDRRVDRLSRGEQMKVSLLLALAPRPALLLMDEPFTGIDVLVRDALVSGLLATVTDVGTTIVVASHDIDELEHIVDHVAMLSAGRLLLSDSTDALRERFRRVTVTTVEGDLPSVTPRDRWLAMERTARRMTFVADGGEAPELALSLRPSDAVSVTPLTLRELFTSVAADDRTRRTGRVAA